MASASWDPRALLAAFVTAADIRTPLPAAKQQPQQPATPRRSHFSDDEDDEDVDADEPETPALAHAAAARAMGYDTLCLPLTTEAWRTRWRAMCVMDPASVPASAPVSASTSTHDVEREARAEAWRASPRFEEGEVTITRLDEAMGALVVVSDWLELDAADDWVRHDSEIALLQELAFASYLDVSTAILPPPRNRSHVPSYARALNAALARVPFIQLSVRLPIYDPAVFRGGPPRASEAELNATWEMWDTVRALCAYDPRLSLTLDLTPPLPSVPGVLARWAAEPIRHVWLPASTFIANTKGYPVLPRGAQTFIRDVMKHRPTVILVEAGKGHHTRGGEAAYLQYVRHLEKTSPSVVKSGTAGTVEHFARGYQDFLQAPLQPLMDNLASVTYSTFEQDPVKYQKYEEAVYRAVSDWPPCDRLVLIVAGAGRGPLVARALHAVERAQRKVHVYALEKNPNAFVTLQGRKRDEWGDGVELVFGDMRSVQVPESADIVVSELLGSFGDNELSPECLDGAMRFLKPGGISIPASYTAHLAPLSSSKLYNEVRAGRAGAEKAAETPYVVMLQAVNILSGEGGGEASRCGHAVQECWEFEHPRRDAVLDEKGLPPTNTHNTRSANLRFYIPHAGVLHGFAGYFEAVLYGDVELSIHPERMERLSKDMLSWFPLFFPLKDPLYLPSNSELHVSLWRLTNARQVWYEWCAEAFLPVFEPPPAPSPASPTPLRISGLVDGFGAVHAQPPTPYAAPSPLIDALDSPTAERSPVLVRSSAAASGREMGVVKIGQTALHNPGGRSSWIGL